VHASTRFAREAGVDVIVQAAFGNKDWFGRVDVLRKIAKPSRLGDWSYEVFDCKLAHETKAATILQLSLYSELVGAAQGALPDAMYVVPPGETFEPERYRTLDYAAYYRYVKSRLEAVIGANGAATETYPEPTPHCDICRWQRECDKERRGDDHLSLVAGINKLQRKQLGIWETTTVAGLAAYPLPIPHRPVYGSRESYVRVREQARVQVAGRESGTPVHEVLEMTDGHGLSLLPEPSPGDVFFDLEGDPFVGLSGREYLFGVALPDGSYEYRWGLTADQERDAFVWFVDLVMARRAEHPAMHVYHYAPYEPSALKRLMGRYGVREDEIDAVARTVDIKKTKKTAEVHPTAVFVDKTGPSSEEQADALYRLGDWTLFEGVNAPGPYRAARDLLLRIPPRLADGTTVVSAYGEDTKSSFACVLRDTSHAARQIGLRQRSTGQRSQVR